MGKCCVGGCTATSETHRVYCIPKNDSLRNLWMSFLVPTNPLLIGLSNDQLLRKRVCEKHFDKHQFDEEGKRLRYSYPCLFTDDEIAHGEPLSTAGIVQDVLSDHNYCKEQDDEEDITSTSLVVGRADNAANIVGAIHILGWTHCGCMAHKLNLTLQHPLRAFDDTLKKNKKIVTYYRNSYKAKEKLTEYQAKVQGSRQPLVLINSVPTRWNSTYFMIERFVHLQDAVRAMTPNLDVDLPIITGEEWTALRQLCKVLKPFAEATAELSAEQYVCASKAIAVINGLKDVMEELKRRPAYFNAIKNIVKDIEKQLNSRFQDLEQDQCLALCTILDPRYKISMFIDESAAEGVKSSLVRKVFNLLVTDETGRTPLPTVEAQSSRVDDDEISLWRKRKEA